MKTTKGGSGKQRVYVWGGRGFGFSELRERLKGIKRRLKRRGLKVRSVELGTPDAYGKFKPRVLCTK